MEDGEDAMPCAGLGALGKQTLSPLASVMTQASRSPLGGNSMLP